MGWVVLFGLAVAHIFLTVAAHESVPVFGQKNVYYLASLPMTDRSIGYGHLGLQGQLGFEGLTMLVEGVAYKHGVSTHPPRVGSAFVEYDLGAYPDHAFRIQSQVAINDNNNKLGKCCGKDYLLFSVVADGVELWSSEPVQHTGVVQEVDVTVGRGTQRLRLNVHAKGSNACAHAVWADPVITVQ